MFPLFGIFPVTTIAQKVLIRKGQPQKAAGKNGRVKELFWQNGTWRDIVLGNDRFTGGEDPL